MYRQLSAIQKLPHALCNAIKFLYADTRIDLLADDPHVGGFGFNQLYFSPFVDNKLQVMIDSSLDLRLT